MKTLTLRHLKPTDFPEVKELLSDPEVMTFLGPGRPLMLQEIKTWFEEHYLYPSRFVVADTDNDELLGFCGIKHFDNQADFGYFFRRKCWGKGVASSAIELVIRTLTPSTQWEYVDIFIAENNYASLAIANKFGWYKTEKSVNNGHHGYIFRAIPGSRINNT